MTTINKSRMWKDGARRGIVYVEGREAAEKVMALRGGPTATPVLASRALSSHHRTAFVAGRTAGIGVPVSPGEAELKGRAAMAVYLDRKGKPFAWQISFAMEDWDRVTALVGPEAAAA